MLRIAAAGVGAGAYNTVINASLAERYRERSAMPLMLVHAAATIGAIAGAPLMGWVASAAHWTLSFRALGVAHLVLAGWAAWVELPAPARDTEEQPRVGCTIVPYLCMSFAYVGIEASATAFAVPYAVDAAALPASRGRFAISALWLGVLVSRALALFVRDKLGRAAFVVAGIAGALILAGGALGKTAAVEIFFAALGLAVGFVYPLLMTHIGSRFASTRGTAAGLAGGAGAAGGFAAPWIIGAVGERAGVGVALASLALWSAVMAAAAALTQSHSRAAGR
jgi:MFS family permease